MNTRSKSRGFSLVEALLAVAILATGMLAATQSVMTVVNGRNSVSRSREVRQWHYNRVARFQHSALFPTTAAGPLPTITETTSSGVPVTVSEVLTELEPSLVELTSTTTWLMPSGTTVTQTLKGLQAR